MQIKEALEFWKSRYNRTKDYNDIHWESSERREHEEYVEALKTAIEALEKQTPMKPTISHHKYIDASSNKKGEYTLTHCPYCFYKDKELGYFESLVDKHTKCCRRCGQRLDWSDT